MLKIECGDKISSVTSVTERAVESKGSPPVGRVGRQQPESMVYASEITYVVYKKAYPTEFVHLMKMRQSHSLNASRCTVL